MIGRRAHDDAQSFDDAWNSRGPRGATEGAEITELVRFAESLCESAVMEPSTAFCESLRAQLMTEAETVLVATPRQPRTTTSPTRRPHPVRRRIAGLTAALVASAGVISMVASSASAVPGEMLYPVKRGIENVELAVHRDDASRGTYQLKQASERLAEARELSDSKPDSEDLIAGSLDDFASAAESGSTSLFNDFDSSGSEGSIRKVNDFAAAATVDLSVLSNQLPAGADESFKLAAQTVTELATQASSLCSACAVADVESLVSAVTGLTADTPIKQASDATTKATTPKSTGATPTTPATSATTPTKTVTPGGSPVVTPTQPAASDAPLLSGVLDPVVGLLLGDDEQPGLVPGLLGGLLGTKP